MDDIQERIAGIERELRETPHHKATDHHIGRLRAKLAQLKDQQLEQVHKSKGGGGGYGVRKSGDASIVLVGPPSVGKSSLLNVLTDAHSTVAEYDFTTLTVIPGMMDYNGARIQIFDIPGIIEGASAGKGRGKEVLSVARTANLVILMVDVKTIRMLPVLKKELWNFGLRLGETKPRVTVNKKLSGGLKVTSTTPLTHLSRETIKEVASQYRFVNAEVVIKENLTLERLIDGLSPNRVFLPYLAVVNKSELDRFYRETEDEKPLFISVHRGQNLEKLKEAIWEKLGMMKIYLRKDSVSEPDWEEPLILPRETTIAGAAEKISTEMAAEVKSAQIWGESAKYPGQKVSVRHILREGDTVLMEK